MSVRLHIHKTHIIEYGACGFPNSKVDGIYNLLKENGCDIWTNDDCLPTGNSWEIDCEQFRQAVKKIKALPEEAVRKQFYFDGDVTKKEVVDTLESFLRTGCETDGVYHFSIH